jgi:hypothetical protein
MSRRMRNFGLLPDDCTVVADAEHVIALSKTGLHKKEVKNGERSKERVEEALEIIGRGGLRHGG